MRRGLPHSYPKQESQRQNKHAGCWIKTGVMTLLDLFTIGRSIRWSCDDVAAGRFAGVADAALSAALAPPSKTCATGKRNKSIAGWLFRAAALNGRQQKRNR
jgi:hypothetical protein